MQNVSGFFSHRLLVVVIIASLFWGTVSVRQAAAHPHVFVDSVVNFTFDEKGLAAITVRWVFDDITSTQYLMDLDTNGDGQLPAAEWTAQRDEIAGFLADMNFFLHVLVNGERVKLTSVSAFSAIFENGVLRYELTVPLQVPRREARNNVQVALYDPEFYTDFYTPMDEFHLHGQTGGVLLDVDDAPELAFYSGQVIPVAAHLSF